MEDTVDEDDETFYLTTTLRAYNPVLDRWELIGMDGGFGLQDTGTGHRVGDEIHIEQTFGVMTPEPSLWRIRYYDTRPDGFSWAADRSTDGGATWVSRICGSRHAGSARPARCGHWRRGGGRARPDPERRNLLDRPPVPFQRG